MGWKPRVPEVTPEEALEIAREQAKPFWFGSPPVFFPVIDEASGQASLQPLDPRFLKGTWILVAEDAFAYTREGTWSLLAEWRRRFTDLGVNLVWALRGGYEFCAAKEYIPEFLSRYRIQGTVFLDQSGNVFRAMGVDTGPHLWMLDEGKLILSQGGSRWWDGVEQRLRMILRRNDPGLPLPLPFEPEGNRMRDIAWATFGAEGSIPTSLKIKFEGEWKQEAEYRWTQDPKAAIEFRSPGTHVGVLAANAVKTDKENWVIVTAGGLRVPEPLGGKDFRTHSGGFTGMMPSKPRMYQLLQKLSDKTRQVRLEFRSAKEIPTAVYGLRFGDFIEADRGSAPKPA